MKSVFGLCLVAAVLGLTGITEASFLSILTAPVTAAVAPVTALKDAVQHPSSKSIALAAVPIASSAVQANKALGVSKAVDGGVHAAQALTDLPSQVDNLAKNVNSTVSNANATINQARNAIANEQTSVNRTLVEGDNTLATARSDMTGLRDQAKAVSSNVDTALNQIVRPAVLILYLIGALLVIRLVKAMRKA